VGSEVGGVLDLRAWFTHSKRVSRLSGLEIVVDVPF
jgi:hypothetical protein